MVKKPLQWVSERWGGYFKSLDRRARIQLIMLAVGLVLFIPFVAWPAWIVQPFLRLRLTELRERVQSAKVHIQQEPKLLAEKIAHETFIRETQGRLFTEKEVQGILGTLTQIGQKSKVTLLSSQPQAESHQAIPEPHNKKYQSLSYLLSVEGSYHALASFVSEIENYPQVIRVDDFSISPREETPETHLGELKLSVFLKREAA